MLGLLQQCSFNLNFRHRMAQYAGRASVGLHTQASLTLLSTSVTVWRSTRDAPLLACTLRQV